MKKTILIHLMMMLVFGTTYAQTTIANGTFENWDNLGANEEQPAGWSSNRTGEHNAPSGPQTCFRDVNPHSGTYCAKVKTGLAFGIVVVNGSLTTGSVDAPTTSKAEGYIHTRPNVANHSMAFTGRPDSIVFWYKFTKQGSDYPRLEARLHVGNAYAPETPVNNNHPDSTQNIIARAQWTGPASTQGTWTRVSLPFTYVDNRTPQWILITSTSSGDQTGGSNGSTMWLDDIEAIYNPTIATGTVATGPYYVSAAAGATVSVPFTLSGTFNAGNTVTAQLSNAAGSFASPVNIGSVTATASGTITATIPSGTASGSGYRVRVVSSNPALTAADNGTDISVVLVNNSIAPATTQTIAAGVNGNMLTVTETAGATSREWKYAIASGGTYQSFGTAQTGTTYTPNFNTAGTYYIVCVTTYPGSLTVTSNEVAVTVVKNSVTPASAQSILAGVNGTTLTVTETPAGTSREWKYATTSGGPYQSFSTAETGTTYTPNFSTTGVYYVVCESTIGSLTVTSNEVVISVNNVTLSTDAVSGSPFQFSASAPDAQVTVNYTTSAAFNSGNVFTAELSDATGSFASATAIGSVTATTSGSISATIPATTAAGTGYRIRVVGSNPVVVGSDNGTDLTVDQFNNSISPVSSQTFVYTGSGNQLTVSASQTATQQWVYTTTPGSGYMAFNPSETNTTFTPHNMMPGTYYVAAQSINQYNDTVTSNEVEVVVTNGVTLTTSAVSGSPYYVSASANVQVNVDFTSDVIFNNGNEFKAQLSDATGSFASPVEIGTLSSSTIGTINAVIPNSTTASTGYRIRVVSTNPAITGTDNGSDLEVITFSMSVAPPDTQHLAPNQNGNALTVTTSQPSTYEWKYSEVQGLGYLGFTPAETNAAYTPHFAAVKTYYVICVAKNAVNDVFTSQEVVVVVANGNGINNANSDLITAYWSGNNFVVNLTKSSTVKPVLSIINMAGQQVYSGNLNAASVNTISTTLPNGIYLFTITDGENVYSGKSVK